MSNNGKCLICDGESVEERLNEEFQYHNYSITIPNYVVYRCKECKQAIVDQETLKRSGPILTLFRHRVETLEKLKDKTGQEEKIKQKLARWKIREKSLSR